MTLEICIYIYVYESIYRYACVFRTKMDFCVFRGRLRLSTLATREGPDRIDGRWRCVFFNAYISLVISICM